MLSRHFLNSTARVWAKLPLHLMGRAVTTEHHWVAMGRLMVLPPALGGELLGRAEVRDYIDNGKLVYVAAFY